MHGIKKWIKKLCLILADYNNQNVPKQQIGSMRNQVLLKHILENKPINEMKLNAEPKPCPTVENVNKPDLIIDTAVQNQPTVINSSISMESNSPLPAKFG